MAFNDITASWGAFLMNIFVKQASRITGVFAASAMVIFSAADAETYELNKVSFRDITGSIEIVTTSGD